MPPSVLILNRGQLMAAHGAKNAREVVLDHFYSAQRTAAETSDVVSFVDDDGVRRIYKSTGHVAQDALLITEALG